MVCFNRYVASDLGISGSRAPRCRIPGPCFQLSAELLFLKTAVLLRRFVERPFTRGPVQLENKVSDRSAYYYFCYYYYYYFCYYYYYYYHYYCN